MLYQILTGAFLLTKTGLLDHMQDLQEDQLDGTAGAVSNLGYSNARGKWERSLLWDAIGASFTFCF
jgi:hypothetical protein